VMYRRIVMCVGCWWLVVHIWRGVITISSPSEDGASCKFFLSPSPSSRRFENFRSTFFVRLYFLSTAVPSHPIPIPSPPPASDAPSPSLLSPLDLHLSRQELSTKSQTMRPSVQRGGIAAGSAGTTSAESATRCEFARSRFRLRREPRC